MDCSQIKSALTHLLDLRAEFIEAYSRVDENKGHHDPENIQAIESSESLIKEIKREMEAWESQLKEITFSQLERWLKEENLESKLEGGSLEALIKRQEQFYQKMYGKGFTIDRSKIRIDKSRLKAIAQGLETGAVNYPLIIATPEALTEKELAQTEAQFAYHKLLEPLKKQGLKIWKDAASDDPNDPERWTKLTLEQVLEGYLPVEISDFDQTPNQAGQIPLEQDWAKEIQRIIKSKEVAPKIKPQQIKLIFTDSRQDIPQDQKPITQSGEVLSNEEFNKIKDSRRFTEMVKAQVNVLNPQEWITLAAQLYAKDKTYLSRNTWDWLMAILTNKEGVDPPVSAADASSLGVEVYLFSVWAGIGFSIWRWRFSL